MATQRKMRRADTKEVNEVMAMARNDPALMARINNAIANGLIQITPEGIFVDEAAASPEPTSGPEPYNGPVWDTSKPQRIGSDMYGSNDKFISKSTFELAAKEPLAQANEARERMAAIRADKSHPYWNEHDPRHAGAVQEVQALYNAQYYEDGTPVLEEEESKP